MFHGRTTHLATEALLPPGHVFGTALRDEDRRMVYRAQNFFCVFFFIFFILLPFTVNKDVYKIKARKNQKPKNSIMAYTQMHYIIAKVANVTVQKKPDW